MKQQWIELRSHGRMWARYNPHSRIIEFARQDVRATFNLNQIESAHTKNNDEPKVLVDNPEKLCYTN